jgi:hypothetical protein
MEWWCCLYGFFGRFECRAAACVLNRCSSTLPEVSAMFSALVCMCLLVQLWLQLPHCHTVP